MYARIVGTGSYLPEKVVTNHDLATRIDTSDDWIVTRTGISQRHIAAATEATSDLGTIAAQRAMTAANASLDEVDLIIVATTTPDMVFPSTASIIQRKLGITNQSPAFDVQAVCAGFIHALATADLYVRAGKSRCALVIGCEIYSRILDWEDRTTCVLFGDGAGAVVLRPDAEQGILSTHLHADGRHTDMLCVPGWVDGGQVVGRPLLHMDGNSVFRFAVKCLGAVAEEALLANGLAKEALDWLVPHQANIRIIEATAKKLALPLEKVIVTVGQHGNTSAASIPLALDVGVRDGRIQAGQTLLLEGIGGGFAWGAVLARF